MIQLVIFNVYTDIGFCKDRMDILKFSLTKRIFFEILSFMQFMYIYILEKKVQFNK